MAADRRSVHPDLPGLPWWAAIGVAAMMAITGVVLDAGKNELTNVFTVLYVLGCVTAVLAVRQSGVFTAVIQPPLILFCIVPGAYWLFHGATFTGLKGILINCGYPLIERFPLMLFTSAGVLLIGIVRWYFGTSAPTATPQTDAQPVSRPRWLTTMTEKLTSKLINRDPAHAAGAATARRPRATDRPRRTTTRRTGTGKRSVPPRSRHVRPPMDDSVDPRAGRPRRRPLTHAYDEEPGPRRRPRPPQDANRRDPYLSTGRPTAHNGERDLYRPDSPNGDGTHHPISRVRYRRGED